MSTEMGTAIGWDEERIENPNEGGDFVTLPPGKYNFTVDKFERGRFEGSAKMCACPKAVLTLGIEGGELGTVSHKHNLYLNKKCEGMLCQFFVSVGLRKHGDPLVLAWNQLVGRAGTLELGNRTHNEKVYNDVKKFLDPPEQSEAPAQETEEIPF
jgi:hypothetical protein